MAIFDQRQHMTFGSDLFRMITAMQEMQIRKEDLKMRQQEHKLKVEETEFAAANRQGAMHQILQMPGALDNVSQGAAAQIADASQPAAVPTAQVTREAATGALQSGNFAEAAVAAQYLGLPPDIPLAIQKEERKTNARRGLEVMLGDEGSHFLDAIFLAEQGGSPALAQVFTNKYFDANPSAIQKLQRTQMELDIERTQATIKKIFADLNMLPLDYEIRLNQLDLAKTQAERDRMRLGMEIELFPLQVEAARVDLTSRQLANDLSRALNPLRVTGAQNQLILEKYTIEERAYISEERTKALAGQTEPQIALRGLLVHSNMGFTAEEADAMVRGMDRQTAARTMLAIGELQHADQQTRRRMTFELFREFAMPHFDAMEGWSPPAITDPQQLARIIGVVSGDMLPIEETAAMGMGVMYSFIAGGENPADPAVVNATVEEVVGSLNAVLVGVGEGQIPANALSPVEEAELRKAIELASQEDTVTEAYEVMFRHMTVSPKLKAMRERLNAIDAGIYLKTVMSENMYQRQIEEAMPPEALANPRTLEGTPE